MDFLQYNDTTNYNFVSGTGVEKYDFFLSASLEKMLWRLQCVIFDTVMPKDSI